MIEMQIQLDETTYALAKHRALAENKPLDEIIRDALEQYLAPSSKQPAGLEWFTFIGSGQPGAGTPRPVNCLDAPAVLAVAPLSKLA